MPTYFTLVYALRNTGRASVPRGRPRPRRPWGERLADVGEWGRTGTEVAPHSPLFP